MRVILPHVGAERAVSQALDATGWTWEDVNVGDSDHAYYDLLSGLWSVGETVAIVEHDIVVHPSALDELAECPHDWCAFGYDYMGYPHYGLGCVKFGAGLMARNPDAMRRVGWLSDARHERRHWCRLDAWLQEVVLPGEGERLHRHTPFVSHLGRGCSHGCTSI